jgi:CheY-like chemotaxis protein
MTERNSKLSLKVLVVEDNAMNRELAVTILEAAGFVVVQAVDAESGVALAFEEHPDVILMDVGLPGVDGLAATRTLKDDPRTASIPVIAVSAHAMKVDESRALAYGADAYVTKPIDTRSLAEIVRRFAERRTHPA